MFKDKSEDQIHKLNQKEKGKSFTKTKINSPNCIHNKRKLRIVSSDISKNKK